MNRKGLIILTILAGFCLVLVSAGCGTEEDPLDLLAKCDQCSKYFHVKQGDFDKKVYCPNCGNEMTLNKGICYRYGPLNKPVKIKYQVTRPNGAPRKPWKEIEERYNKLASTTRFDRVTGRDVEFVDGKPLVRHPQDPVPEIDTGLEPEDPRKEIKKEEIWIKKNAPYSEGIKEHGKFSNDSKRFMADQESKLSEVMKPIIIRDSMRTASKFIEHMEEKHIVKYPDEKFRLDGVTDQDTVPRPENLSRKKRLDILNYLDLKDHNGVPYILNLKNKIQSLKEVDVPEALKKDAEALAAMQDENQDPPSALVYLKRMRKRAEPGAKNLNLDVIRADEAISWVDARRQALRKITLQLPLDVEKEMKKVNDAIEEEINKCFGDVEALKSGAAPEPEPEVEPEE